MTSEVRVLRRASSGVMVSSWQLVDTTRRNECLDTIVYSEAAARKKGWASMTDGQWEILAAERSEMPPEAQSDLFDLVQTSALPADPPDPVPLSQQAAAPEAPRVRTKEPFGTQGFSMTVEHDFGLGAVDYRGGYKNAGL